MRTSFTMEDGNGSVAVLLNLRGQPIRAWEADEIRRSLKRTMDINTWNIGVYYRWVTDRKEPFMPHAAYDQCYFNAIRDKGISSEVRSRIIRREDTDDLAENQPISDRFGDFYAHRKAWKYRYSFHKEDAENGSATLSFYLRRSGTHPRNIAVGQSINLPE